MALRQEFDELHFDSKDRKLSVETESIRLDGLDLGRFKIELDVESLSSKNNAYYEVIALDPNPAESNDNTVHPHVDANRLCEGEAQPTIRLALRQGRLLDFFQIVRQVLSSYNPSSAYTKIADWSGALATTAATRLIPMILATVGVAKRKFVWIALAVAATVIVTSVETVMIPVLIAMNRCANLVASPVKTAMSLSALNV